MQRSMQFLFNLIVRVTHCDAFDVTPSCQSAQYCSHQRCHCHSLPLNPGGLLTKPSRPRARSNSSNSSSAGLHQTTPPNDEAWSEQLHKSTQLLAQALHDAGETKIVH
eukprot:TRINITY_DN52144_c0_g1_i1.p1 TRINITY_DN52144_c0_g1~~TRINITY_DN52144_c0_g1_i1.p1  ORF type:complete len:108 (-),score=8.83 TRINITY_DN52144_c0_g1_i1:5-328(-)